MRIEYNPRKFLLLVPLPMLRQYFDGRGVLGELAWDDLKEREKDYELVYAAWQAVPTRVREAIGADFLNVAGLATKQGVQVIIEEGKFHDKDLVAELAALPSHTEKALYTLLQYPRVFRVASQLNYADNLTRYWHRRHDLPKKPPDISTEARVTLRKAVSEYYVENQGRGHYQDFDLRRHGPVHYFIVYLSDYPDAFAGFDDEGKMRRQPQTPAFDVVFRYDESRGHLDLYAEGPKQLRRDLEELFAKTVLSEDLSLQAPPGVAFYLDHLKNPSFSFLAEPADGIFNVTIRTMQLSVPDKSTGRVTFELMPYADGGNIHQLIEDALNKNNWRLEDLRVDQVKLKVTFLHGKPRPKTVTFNISPTSCPLKDHVAEHAIIKRHLKQWEIERE
jgi:hypothetical protein